MPTYAYRCKSCSYEFEELQKVTEDPLVICPSCNKPTLIRLIHGGIGIHFKGSGFYQTDYKKSGSSGAEKPSTPSKTEAKSETSASSEAKSESKPAESTPKTSGGEEKK